jgi:YebC/PmpR family DNA-binding regulatory protein
MAGHSKWANIKFRKDRQDVKKGKVFSRIAKEIISAVKVGGADPKGNPRLRLVLQKARTENVPNTIVERNIKKASDTDQADYTEMSYELYGHGGVGIIVDIMTDNKNRISSDIRIATNKRGGVVGTQGSVSYNFEKRGVIQVNPPKDKEAFIDVVIEVGGNDFQEEEGVALIFTDPVELYAVKEALETRKIEVIEASLHMWPKTYVQCDQETEKANQALIEWLENIDDVDAVFHNME